MSSDIVSLDLLQLATFCLGSEEYALDIASVQEIVRMTTVTRVPHAPEFIEGVVNLRGKIVPVIDLRARFGLPPVEATQSTRIIIAQVAGTTVGLIVDAVREVLRLSSGAIEPTPVLVSREADTAFCRGVGKLEDRLILLLDLPHLLAYREVQELAGMHAGPAAS